MHRPLLPPLVSVAMLWSPGPLTAQRPPTFDVAPVAGIVSTVVLGTPDGNAYGANMVLAEGPAGAILVDTNLPAPPLTAFVVDQVNARTGVEGLRLVVVTHWHPDHSGGVSGFSGLAPVVAHARTVARLSEETQGVGLVTPESRFVAPPRAWNARPSLTVGDSSVFELGDERVHLMHVPGAHTDGDLVVWFESSGVAAVGDLVWPGLFPSIDAVNGGDARGLLAAVGELVDRLPPETVYVPGHGRPLTGSEVRTWLDALDAGVGDLTRRHAAGESLDQVIAGGLGPVDGLDWSMWGHAVVPESRWIELVWESLERERR